MPESALKAEGSPPKQPTPSATQVSARRLKKREIDRKCQRQARERTRSRIEYLESLVENLQQPDGDERSAALMKRLRDVEKERDSLTHTLKSVQKAIFGLENLADQHIKTDADADDPDPNLLQPVDFVNGARHPKRNNSLTETSSPTSPALPDAEMPPLASQKSRHLSTSAHSDNSKPEVPTQIHNVPCECCQHAGQAGPAANKSTWRVANDTLMTNFKRLSPIMPEEDLASEDILIRAVLEGWDSVAAHTELPASWRIMRRLDEQIFCKAGGKERLAMLKTLHLMLQYHRDPSADRRAKIPPWYLQRPSQSAQPHAYAINYFVWPGLRERFVFDQHKYCNNLFATMFQACLQILWPYDFRDCFAQRWDTGQYDLSPAFRDTISDITKWTMRPEMFQQFPELRCDIPSSYNSPFPISNVLQMQLAGHRSNSTSMPSLHSSSKQTPISNESVTPAQMTMAESWISHGAMAGWVDSSAYTQGYVDHTLQANWAVG